MTDRLKRRRPAGSETAPKAKTAPPQTAAAETAGALPRTALQLQALAGNRATGGLIRDLPPRGAADAPAVLRQRAPARDVTFSEEEGSVLTSSQSTADARLRSIHHQMTSALGDWHQNAIDGLANFGDTMSLASDQETEPRVLDAMGKAFFKAQLSGLIDLIPLASIKHIAKTVVDVGMAAWEEEQRAAQSSGERRIAAFITATRDALADSRTTVRADHRRQETTFLRTFPGDRSARVLDSDQQAWLETAERSLRTFETRIPRASAFRQQITERFADTGGNVGLVNQGTWRASGTLSLGSRVRRSGSGDWTVEGTDSRWVLHTSAPNPERVAQNLKESLNGSPMFSTLLKEIRINVDADGDQFQSKMMVQGALERGPRIWFTFGRYDRDRARVQRREEMMNAIGRSGTVAQALLAVTNIAGSSD